MDHAFPKFRDDLIVSRQEFEKVVYYVIKDPVTQKFFRVKEFEYFIAQNLDGKTSPEEITEKFSARFSIPLPLDTLNKFIQRLESLGFLESEASERELAQLQHQKLTFPGKLLFIKLKGFDPDRILNRLFRYTRFVFTPYFLIASLIVIFISALITIGNWNDLGYSFTGLFKIATIFKIWIAIFLVVVLHEFSHALTCKYFGGEVHEMGFLLLYFQPCFYCNVSDTYLFPEKSKRMWVTFAGAYCQVFLWAFATILWRITALDTWLGSFLFVVMITSGVTVLFNFNPLIKLDGYYLLTDYLEIPNLRAKAFGYLSAALKGRLMGQTEPGTEVSARARKIYFRYGILSLVYSALLLFFIALRVERFLVRHMGGFGFVLFLILLFLIIRKPLGKMLGGMWRFFILQKEKLLTRRRIIIYSVIVLVVLLLLFLVKAELKIGNPCEIRALESFTLRSMNDGTIVEELFRGGFEEKKAINHLRLFAPDYTTLNFVTTVKEGEKVDSGQIIAALTSPSHYFNLLQVKEYLQKAEDEYNLLQKGETEEAIQQARNELSKIQSELSLKEKELKISSGLFEKQLISSQEWEKVQSEHSVLSNELEIAKNELKILEKGNRPEEIAMAEREFRRWEARLAFLEGQATDAQIRSPILGVVTSISSSGILMNVSNIDTVRVMISVSEKDMDVLQEGHRVKLKVQSFPFNSFWGEVTKISQIAEAGEKKKIFPVICKIENQDHLLKPGMTGYAKVFCGKRSLFNLLTRRIVRYLKVEVWSWW
jgi:putative peptide zinc metalloprotease protein